MTRFRASFLWAAFGCALVCWASAPAPEARGSEAGAPSVAVFQVSPVPENEPVRIRARVADPQGVGRVVLHVRGERADEFREIPMEAVSADAEGVDYAATWAPSPERGRQIAFYVEAWDRLGNGPRLAGNPRYPFVARLLAPRPVKVRTASDWVRVVVLVGLGVLVAIIATLQFVVVRERRRNGLRKASGADASPRPGAGSPEAAVKTAREIADERFWFNLLSPLRGMYEEEVERTLRMLSSRIHAHPVEGKRLFPYPTLRRKLEWVRRADPRTLHRQWESFERVGGPPPDSAPPPRAHPRQDGFTLVEVLGVLAVFALLVSAAAIYLEPMKAPLRTGAQQVESMIQHTRGRAMATMTPHRLRPLSDQELVVESADSCSSGTWMLEPDLRLVLPDGVRMSDTSWSACFTSRGTAVQNEIVTLAHHDRGTTRLEILLGGAVRWL